MKASENFEQQIRRIHRLVEADAVVTWNDKVPDPDNPGQLRQIDVTIRRDQTLTIVECRIHNRPQDVQWIEELIGRRASLRADSVIAVSHAGFTQGAILKAKSHGIVLRDLVSLTEEEIRSWGRRTRVSVLFHTFNNVVLSFAFEKAAQARLTPEDIQEYYRNEDRYCLLIETIVKQISHYDERQFHGAPSPVVGMLIPKKDIIKGHCPKELIFWADYHIARHEARIPSVVAYDGPDIDALQRHVLVENVEVPDFQITQSSNDVSVVVDFNKIGIPLNSRIKSVDFDFQRPVRVKHFEVLAQPKIVIPLKDVAFHIKFQ